MAALLALFVMVVALLMWVGDEATVTEHPAHLLCVLTHSPCHVIYINCNTGCLTENRYQFFATHPYSVDAPGKIYPNVMSVNPKASAQLPWATLGAECLFIHLEFIYLI